MYRPSRGAGPVPSASAFYSPRDWHHGSHATQVQPGQLWQEPAGEFLGLERRGRRHERVMRHRPDARQLRCSSITCEKRHSDLYQAPEKTQLGPGKKVDAGHWPGPSPAWTTAIREVGWVSAAGVLSLGIYSLLASGCSVCHTGHWSRHRGQVPLLALHSSQWCDTQKKRSDMEQACVWALHGLHSRPWQLRLHSGTL